MKLSQQGYKETNRRKGRQSVKVTHKHFAQQRAVTLVVSIIPYLIRTAQMKVTK